MVGNEIRDEDRKNIHSKYICTYCDDLLVNPIQTSCEHLFCQSCIEILFGCPNPKCTEDEEHLNRNNIFPNDDIKQELNCIVLHCPNEKCKWLGPYQELKTSIEEDAPEHMNDRMESLEGRGNSNSELSPDSKCPEDEEKLIKTNDHIDSVCENAPVVCKYCKKNIPRKDNEHYESTTCDEVPTKCEFQAIGCNYDKLMKRKESQQHMNENLIDHVSALLRHVMAFVKQLSNYVSRPELTTAVLNMADQVTAVRANLSEKFLMLVGKLTDLERSIESLGSPCDSNDNNTQSLDVSSMVERIATLEQQVKDNSSTILRFRESLDEIDESLARNTVKITDLEVQRGSCALGSNQAIHSYNGTSLWMVDNIKKKRQDAINGIKTALYSPPFYSSQYGYKMCAKIYMNGDGFGKGTHLSLFFVVMKDGARLLKVEM
ncbi:TNF receptor-associated factor 3-like [Xenia sp. Carnegie-2017]|uniref:TNF receptor-associated factor 3-like n=1 Tax=Xenia sp. Carnegie-2017 TaxID=2897299 RepID=UPI001F03778C|nr:TNF receptor-associated factor 3-like [Xenia sp. Carnegie-2017]